MFKEGKLFWVLRGAARLCDFGDGLPHGDRYFIPDVL